MIAVTKIGSTVISMHVYDDHRITVAQVSPGGQDYDYRITHSDLQQAHDAYLSLIMSAIAGRDPQPRLREDQAYAMRQRGAATALRLAARDVSERLTGTTGEPAAVAKRLLLQDAERRTAIAALWEER